MIIKLVTIRKATVQDVPQIVDLAIGLINYHRRIDVSRFDVKEKERKVRNIYKKCFISCLGNNKKILLAAEYNNKIIGYSFGSIRYRSPIYKRNRIGYINDVFIKSDFRRRKIGEKFLAVLIKWFRLKKAECIELTVHANNKIGQQAWKKYKFETFMLKQRRKM